MTKERIDILLVEKGFIPTREKAKTSIMAGIVYVDGNRVDKPGTKVSVDANIEIKGEPHPYVSRGGLKLERAIEAFSLDLAGLCLLDIGASTGGFTDCALQHGAAKVYAVDVGYGQLAWKLRQDPRVVVMERTNFRYLTPQDFPVRPDGAVIDVSFISLTKILPPLSLILNQDGWVVALVKPQFEAGRESVGKNGIVKDPVVHRRVLHDVYGFARGAGLVPVNLSYSPIKGGEGNIEFLLHMVKGDLSPFPGTQIDDIVDEAHRHLDM